ncbi:MAG: hypothetical protein KGL39_27090 [Patescibacteria group bacterium]|nr:hypothetical protein [Patescibacteria group bacterium]
MNSIIHILPSGEIVALKTPMAASILTDEFGQVETRRASHILPCRRVKRIAFRLLRAVFGERGRTAEWTRSWRGPWQVSWAHTPGTPVFSHPSRRVCVEWEQYVLSQNMANN